MNLINYFYVVFTAAIASLKFNVESVELNIPDPWVFQNQEDDPKELNITCRGEGPLQWETELERQYYNVYDSIAESGEYVSTLNIGDSLVEDTGNFICIDRYGKTASSYVYVYDGKNAFVEPGIGMHTAIEVGIGEEIFLDCRVSHPNITVTVFMDYDQSVKFKETDYEFDPKIGVRITSDARGMHGNVITVTNSLNNEKFEFIIRFNPDKKSNKLPQANIIVHKNAHYVVGDEFSLNCTIPVKGSRLPDITWHGPNPFALNVTYRLRDMSMLPTIFVKGVLFMTSPTMNDSGFYICTVLFDGKQSKKSIFIKIKEKIHPYAKFEKKDSKNIINTSEGLDITWISYFRAYPYNIKFLIKDPFGKEIANDSLKFISEFDINAGHFTLRVRNIMAEDFGRHTKILTTDNGTVLDETHAIFAVNATPKVRFIEGISFDFPVSKPVSISALVIAFNGFKDKPQVTWSWFSQCPNGIGSCNKDISRELPNTVNRTNGPANRFISTVKFNASSSGFIRCTVTTNYGQSSTEYEPILILDTITKFFVSVTLEEGVKYFTPIGAAVEKLELVQGDRVSIECFALDFMYRNLDLEIKDKPINCDSRLSSGKCLMIHEVALEDSGSFECSVLDKKTNKVEVIKAKLHVLEKIVPKILPGSNLTEEGTKLTVEVGKPFKLKCLADGRPRPEITWYKDGENLEDIPNFINKERVFMLDDKHTIDFKFAHKDYEGEYSCKLQSRLGIIFAFAHLQIKGSGLSSIMWVIVGFVALMVLGLATAVLTLVFRIRKESQLRKELRRNQLYLFEKGNIGDLNTECTIDEQAELLPYDRDFEVEKERIKLGKLLGSGAFGRVMLAEVEDLEDGKATSKVAVKMVKDGSDMTHLRALTLELKIMVHLGRHLNIVNLMGAYTANMKKGDLWILVEYCKFGNILKFVQRHKPKFVNQIDPVTGLIDPQRNMQGEVLSPAPFSRNRGLSNADSQGGFGIRGTILENSINRHASNASQVTRSNSNCTVRPGMYAGNPQYQATELVQSPSVLAETSVLQAELIEPVPKKDQYVLTTQLPTVRKLARQTSSASTYSNSTGYFPTQTEATSLSLPPVTPMSVASGEFIFDSHGNQVHIDPGVVPGISGPFTTTDLVCWAWQVANGMEYLANRKVLHGDLAARNLLLAENNVVKISDFGLSRDIYNDVYMKKGDDIMPIKWMAPEAIQEKKFSTQSDVWAFGITLWEFFTLGNTPYPGIPLNQEFTIALERGLRMEKPKYCNEEIYQIILDCWRRNPTERPSFSNLTEQLVAMLSSENTETYMTMNDVLLKRNEEWMQFKEDYLKMAASPDFKSLYIPEDQSTYLKMSGSTMPNAQNEPQLHYLDMSNVVPSSSPRSTSIFSPRAPSDDKNSPVELTMFNFSENIEDKKENNSDSNKETALLLQNSEQLRNQTNKINSSPKNNQNNHQFIVQNNLNSLEKTPKLLHENNNICNSNSCISSNPSYQNLKNMINSYENSTDSVNMVKQDKNIDSFQVEYINTSQINV